MLEKDQHWAGTHDSRYTLFHEHKNPTLILTSAGFIIYPIH